MKLQADFTEGEGIKFQEIPPHPPDLRRLQSAMFLDRPDLWPVIRRKGKQSALPGQQPLFEEGGETPQLPPPSRLFLSHPKRKFPARYVWKPIDIRLSSATLDGMPQTAQPNSSLQGDPKGSQPPASATEACSRYSAIKNIPYNEPSTQRGDDMDNSLLAVLGRLSPSNQRLIRELAWKLAQLEQLVTPELFDSTLNHQQQFHNWLTHLVGAGTAPGTITHYRHAVLSLLKSAPRPTRAHIESYIASITVKGLTPGTIAFQVSAISSYFRFLADSDIIIVNPTARIRRPRLQRQLRKPPTAQQVLAILNYPKAHRFQTMLLLFIDSGLRLSEAASLRIDGLQDPPEIISVIGKGNKPRQVPISSITAEAIAVQLQQLQTAGAIGLWLFPSPDPSKHIGARAVNRYFDRISANLGFKVTPHQLRHYFATSILSKGAHLKAVSAMLGHADVSTTANIYWHILDQQELIEQHAKYSPLKGVSLKIPTTRNGLDIDHAETLGE